MAAHTKFSKSLKHYAQKVGVSERTIKRRSKAGLPIGEGDDAITFENTPEELQGISLDEAKRRRQIIGLQRDALNLDVARGELEPKTKVREDGVRIGAVVEAGLSSLVNDLPGMLAGLNENEIREKLVPRLEVLKKTVRKELARATA